MTRTEDLLGNLLSIAVGSPYPGEIVVSSFDFIPRPPTIRGLPWAGCH